MSKEWSSRGLLQAAQDGRKLERLDDDGRWIELSNDALLAAALLSNPFERGRFRIDGVERPAARAPAPPTTVRPSD